MTKEQTAHKIYDTLRENYRYPDDWLEILELVAVLIRQERAREANEIAQIMQVRANMAKGAK